MSTVITRKGAERWCGVTLPPDVAYVVSRPEGRRAVTWAEVHAARRERQALILARKRETRPRRAALVWVAYFDQPLFGGWHAFVETLGERRVWVNRDRPHWKARLMELFPVGRLFADEWADWLPAFAAAFQRGRQCRQPKGVAYLWRQGDRLSRTAESHAVPK